MATDEKKDDQETNDAEVVPAPKSEHVPAAEEDSEGSFASSAVVIAVALAAAIGFLSMTR